jgi:hypothetical protein
VYKNWALRRISGPKEGGNYYYLFTAIGFAPGGSGPYTTQLQQNAYNAYNDKRMMKIS